MRQLLCLCMLSCIALTAMAADSGVPAAKAALTRMAPNAQITELHKAPLPGFYQALVGGRLVYVSADGTWIMDGQLYNAEQRRNLTQASMRGLRRKALAAVPDSKRLIFAPAKPKYTVTVFTDLDCPYCRVFHQHIKEYNAEGIAVEYLLWPRTGLHAVPSGKPTPAYLKAVSVWCADDRNAAFTAAKDGETIPTRHCPNPVASEYKLGLRIGVNGTPAIIAADGTELGGYLSPPKLLQALRQLQSTTAAK